MRYSPRLATVKRSYIREILKATQDPAIISFAGGLPSPDHFPSQAFAEAAHAVLTENGAAVLQYSITEGYPPLREYIARRYADTLGLDVPMEQILITTGSQQGLDLMAKVFLDPGDGVLMERPGYLGAIQAFSLFGAAFDTVDLGPTGVDLAQLEAGLAKKPKLFYAVPNFQNPSGCTYDEPTRREVARLLAGSDTVLVEDNPYGELRFSGTPLPPLRAFAQGACTVLLGSFSKIASPGMRVGWLVADPDLMHKLVTAKQASDLHTSIFTQRVLHRFLTDNDLDAHIAVIRKAYGERCQCMLQAIRASFPEEVRYTEPEGGMFLWVQLPEGLSSERLFQKAIARKVAFVPGHPFYVDGTANSLRLNFSNSTPERIEEGIHRLAECLKELLATR
ncbi:aminotransferase-like domain-containing protein [Megalodesulfovibrio gigas]|uniref:Putative GntR family transcriptional regulator n=1 Tax=Megalodesulfovibrio gigas (strain ATCC 19364 / DSM 1382 / NCIMB 9332 / VKM B-1759) TaxID=1121448 RepID=T2G8A1_MEGG1|nr:PLP-dependent aminotransferase family protein [Megalodesulfovibrio gigas]AGW12513.1 putative GntR family transcriptional regulator [Megalodesulfovibrio gigas DSM 1382 = ATCC 19364]